MWCVCVCVCVRWGGGCRGERERLSDITMEGSRVKASLVQYFDQETSSGMPQLLVSSKMLALFSPCPLATSL